MVNKRIHIWWQVTMYSFFFFVLMSFFIHHQVTDQFDQFFISLFQRFENPSMTTILTLFTNLCSFLGTIIVLFILLFIFFTYNWQKEAIVLTIVTLVAPIVNLSLKHIFERPRPHLHQLIDITGYSFPSGHTMYATALYGMTLILLWDKLKKWSQRLFVSVFTFLMTFTIAISRIYLGVHYPSDIIGGFIASLFIISFVYYCVLLIDNKKTNLHK